MLRGAEETITNLRRVRDEVKKEVFEGHKRAVLHLERQVRRRVSRTFQEVPSYILDSKRAHQMERADLRYKQYPAGTIGTFARRAPSIASTPWSGLVQLRGPIYPGGPMSTNELRSQLDTAVRGESTGQLVGEVGYTKDVDVTAPEVRRVLFGTPKMQPRPFLTRALDAARAEYRYEIEKSVLTTLARFGALPATREETAALTRRIGPEPSDSILADLERAT